MSQILTTDSVAPDRRLAYWIDLICQTYVQLGCEPVSGGTFDGSIRTDHLPGLELSVVNAGPQRVLRTPREIACSTDDYFIVSIQTQGRALISQDGRTAAMSPGDFAIYDSTRPYTLFFDNDFEEIVLKLRRDRLHALVRDTNKLTATTVSGRAGAGHLMIEMINTLRTEIDTLAPASAVAVADGVINILVAGLQTIPACGSVALPSLAAYHLGRIKRRIDARLRDPALSVASIAADLGLSVAHVHRLFKNEPLSPSQYLWSRRLEACSHELLDPRRANATVAEIAFSWGFNDAAHFSRAFRERFGLSPRAWRQQAAAH